MGRTAGKSRKTKHIFKKAVKQTGKEERKITSCLTWSGSSPSPSPHSLPPGTGYAGEDTHTHHQNIKKKFFLKSAVTTWVQIPKKPLWPLQLLKNKKTSPQFMYKFQSQHSPSDICGFLLAVTNHTLPAELHVFESPKWMRWGLPSGRRPAAWSTPLCSLFYWGPPEWQSACCSGWAPPVAIKDMYINSEKHEIVWTGW